MSKDSNNDTFNFDLNKMENALNSKKHRVPNISSDEAFDKWIEGDEEAFDYWIDNFEIEDKKNKAP